MSKWIYNLRSLIDKPVVLLHGNVRDRYIDEDGRVFENLTALLTQIARESTITFRNVALYDTAGLERSINLNMTLDDHNAEPANNLFAGTRGLSLKFPLVNKSHPPVRFYLIEYLLRCLRI